MVIYGILNIHYLKNRKKKPSQIIYRYYSEHCMHWVIFYFSIVWHRPQPSRKVKDKQAPHIKEKVLSGVKTQKELKAEEQRKVVQEKRLKKDRTKGSIVVASYNLWDGEWLVSLEFVAKKIFVIYAQINIYVVN